MAEYQEQRRGGEEVIGKVFVGGLSWQTNEASLRHYFEKYGELTDAAIMTDKKTGQPRCREILKHPQFTHANLVNLVYYSCSFLFCRGFGFITMKDPAGMYLR